MAEKRLVLVVGSGRSGTSLFAGMLQALGCHVPQPEIKADASNPRGFAEPAWVVNFHYRLLRQAGVHMVDARPSSWAKTAQLAMDRGVERELRQWLAGELERPEPVVIKDPRLVWFLSLWEVVASGLGASMSYATLLRAPQDAYKSRQSHYGDRRLPSSAVAGWINTMLHAERATRGKTRSYPRYDALLEDWSATMARVCSELQLPVLDTVTAHQQRAANQLVDPSLRRSAGNWDDSPVHRQVAEMADEVWRLFDRLPDASASERETITKSLDGLRAEYADFYAMVEDVAESSILRIAPPKVVGKPERGRGGRRTLAQRVKRKLKRTFRGLLDRAMR